MSMKATIEQFDSVLKPLGFIRHKRLWNRQVASFVDAVDLQIGKSGDTFTVNVGVLDVAVHTLLWGSSPPMVVEPAICTVGARVGELIDGKDLWWKIDNSDAGDAADKVLFYVLPFFQRMHEREAMKQWLNDADVAETKYPFPIINLAILECFLGNDVRGCGILAEL